MVIEMRQQMKLSQQLVMTPQLQQAIKLLQLSRLELQDVLRQELEENPVLEESSELEEDGEDELAETEQEAINETPQEAPAAAEPSQMDWDSYLEGYNYTADRYYDEDDSSSYENLLIKKGTLTDHLTWQLNLNRFTESERRIGSEIIGNIDEDGYFRASLADVSAHCAVEESSVEAVLLKVQEFDPPGVGARDLREGLLLQVRSLGMEDSLVWILLKDHLKDLEKRRYKQIARILRVDIQDILTAVKIISGLDPKPGRQFGQEEIQYISTDIFVYKIGDEYVVMLNDEGFLNLRVNPLYSIETKTSRNLDAKSEEYINDKMRSALWLIKSVHQRQRTIYKVTKSIIKYQREFMERGIEHLKPLVLRDIAEDIGMHESTISRVTTNKYMQTPQGLFELKYFFNSGISSGGGEFIASETVKNRIKEIIEAENPKKPYSDQRLVALLAEHSITIARRTVTKYREILRIGSSSERKRIF